MNNGLLGKSDYIGKDTTEIIKIANERNKVINDWKEESINYNINEQIKYQPDANQQVLAFIFKFGYHTSINEDGYEFIRQQFHAGYCYYFAEMLKAAFGRGEVCWCAPYSHFAWVDTDGMPYDIEGICSSEAKYYVPSHYLGDAINDFKHVPGVTFNASKEDIDKIIKAYEKDMGIIQLEVIEEDNELEL